MEHLASDLFASNLLAWFAQVALLVCVACGLPTLLGIRSPGTRLAFWYVTLAVALLLPIVQPWQAEPVSKAATMTIASVEAAGPAASAPIGVGKLIVWVTVVGIVFRLAWLGLGLVSLAGYRRQARPIETPTPRSQPHGVARSRGPVWRERACFDAGDLRPAAPDRPGARLLRVPARARAVRGAYPRARPHRAP